MFFKDKRKWIVPGVILLLVTGVTLIIRDAVKVSYVRERQREAQTALNLFQSNLTASLKRLDYASQLSYAVNADDQVNLPMFKEMAQRMLEDHESIVCLSYFDGDTLNTIIPEDEYKEVKGRKLHELSYSYTLAKVIREPMIEGPEELKVNNRSVFLFIYPIVRGTEYKGELTAAVDSSHVISQMGLDILNEGGYDYELWRVNALGEHKMVIAVSDENIDFSDALKYSFNLPSTWTLSIIPQGGWIPPRFEMLTDVICAAAGLLIMALAVLACRFAESVRELRRVRYIEPDSGLYCLEGFRIFTDQRIRNDKHVVLSLLYIRLSNYHQMSLSAGREEELNYFNYIRKNIDESFPPGTLAARLSEGTIAIALFEDKDDEQVAENIEEFILQLFWKKQINGKKVFLNPEYSVVSYPADGSDTAALLTRAVECYDRNYKNDREIVSKY